MGQGTKPQAIMNQQINQTNTLIARCPRSLITPMFQTDSLADPFPLFPFLPAILNFSKNCQAVW